MGSPIDEPKRDGDETQHKVSITKPFEIQSTEVTQSLWEKVMGNNPSQFKDPNKPVEQVSWNEVQQFIGKLNQRLGLDCGDTSTKEGFEKARRTPGCFRLPTEAEWEFAARAGTQTAYSFGNDPRALEDFGVFTKNSKNQTAVVKSKKPNDLGLYDVHGNVWEWVQDAYKSDLGKAPQIDPIFFDQGSFRVIRGGSWIGSAVGLRSAFRSRDSPDYRGDDLGFRLVRTPT